jgi:hypothetical protein
MDTSLQSVFNLFLPCVSHKNFYTEFTKEEDENCISVDINNVLLNNISVYEFYMWQIPVMGRNLLFLIGEKKSF